MGNDLRLLKKFRERSKIWTQEDKGERMTQAKQSMKEVQGGDTMAELEETAERNDGPRRSGRKRRPSEKARER